MADRPGRARRRWHESYRRSAVATDLLIGMGAAAVTAQVAFQRPSALKVALFIVAVALIWVSALSLSHGYEKRYLGTTTEEYRAVFHASVALFCLVAFVSYAAKADIGRNTVIVVLPLLLVGGLLSRHMLRRSLYRRRTRGRDLERTVVIGDVNSIGRLIREIRRAPSQGMHVVAACVSGLDTSGDGLTSVEGVPVFGYPAQAMSTVDLFDAEVVAVSNHLDMENKALRRLSWALEERGVDLVVAPGIVEVAGPRLSIRPVAGIPLLHVERPVMSGARRLVKSSVDRTLSVLFFLLAAPVLGLIAIAVRIDSPGPALFRQTRVGARGEEFQMLKFRTMCVDAEARLAEVQSASDAGNAVLFKMKQDPRITRLGRVLRRFSLDELPQLINVLRGEMSLVGPRPPLPTEVAGYAPDAVRRLRVQPGLTGLWQVSGRSDLSWDDSLRLDLWYVDNWSLVLDLQILARTARAVLKGQGAY
ncbi:MAG TPA: sugar transferase [Pedococcus sp.]|uniref:sugar transferase n=1 Tax=Pedococcus sp. TaxID=2860345 RepID=UPI002F93C4EB